MLTHDVKEASHLVDCRSIAGAIAFAHTCHALVVQISAHVDWQDGQTEVLVTRRRVLHHELALVRDVAISYVPVDHANGGRGGSSDGTSHADHFLLWDGQDGWRVSGTL